MLVKFDELMEETCKKSQMFSYAGVLRFAQVIETRKRAYDLQPPKSHNSSRFESSPTDSSPEHSHLPQSAPFNLFSLETPSFTAFPPSTSHDCFASQAPSSTNQKKDDEEHDN